MVRFNLSPSLIGRYFYHDCDRYLRYHATPEQEREASGIPVLLPDTSPVTAALLDAGISWEEQVIRTSLAGRVRVPGGAGALAERSFSIEESFALLPDLAPGEALYQPTIPVSIHFLQKYGLDPELHRFAPCRPDLVVRDGTMLRVIDIKASEELSISHRIQATLYALFLDHALTLLGIDRKVDLCRAGIWLYDRDEPETFDLSLNIRVLEEFLRFRLPAILAAPPDEVSWHLTSRCESCEFSGSCRAEATSRRSVSLIPDLSTAACRYLRDDLGVATLPDLSRFLDAPGSDLHLKICGSLAHQQSRLSAIVQALETGLTIPLEGTSRALPVYEDIGITLTLQRDPVSGRIYAAGFRRFKGDAVYGSPSREALFVAEDPDDCVRVQREFIRALAGELEAVHDYNRPREWADQKSVQTYVYDTYEADLFSRLLADALNDPGAAADALRLRFYYQDAGMADGQNHPNTPVAYPLVVLTREIRRLLALPVPFSLRMPEVLQELQSSRFAFELNPGSLFWHDHGNALKGDAIVMAWGGRRAEALEWIRSELSRRLLATGSLLDGLRERVRGGLVRWPANFRFPRPWDVSNPEISRLLFIMEYESALGALRVQELRSRPWAARVRDGISIPVQKSIGNFWKVQSPIDSLLFEQSATFSYLLVPNGDAGEEAQAGFDDPRYRDSMNPGKSGVCFARVQDTIVDRKAGLLKGFALEVGYGRGHAPFSEGDEAVLHPRFTDFTAKRYRERLLELDAEADNAFLRLLSDPHSFAGQVSEPEAIRREAGLLAKKAGFTPSQARAFEKMLASRLTLVWGPPGTGKTHFLAAAVLALVKARRVHGRRVRVGVTAFTHAAIENLLVKMQESIDEYGLAAELPLYKLRDLRTPKGERCLQALPHDRVESVVDYPALVLGGTVHSFGRLEKFLPSLDILIVDEASQMKPAELALVITALGEEGRLILAGDDLQLPPIVLGGYPVPDDGLPGLEDSIFAYLRHRDDPASPAYTCQLLENWRMNATLSLFPAETLYSSGYAPATEAIGRQQLSLLPGEPPASPGRELAHWILDPTYPLVLCVLENVRTTVENRIEAELVAHLTSALRERLADPATGAPYPATEDGDYRFWRQGLFVVSPHHAQIHAIRSLLAGIRDWQYQPFVDTVDKMQGQEADAVIISYGVSDIETALAEAEFIYSRNRLNVSVTRSRSKCIVFLPRPLLEPPLDLLQNERASLGLLHMLNLQEFCRTRGEERIFDLEWIEGAAGASLTVLRVSGSGEDG